MRLSPAIPRIRPISGGCARKARRSAKRFRSTSACSTPCFVKRRFSCTYRLGHRTGKGRKRLRRSSIATGRRRRALCLRPVADRGLLRRQQADEGLSRHGQYRHQFAAVHGLFGCRAPPRLRRRLGARHLRGSREADLVVLVGSNAAWCHPVLYQRLECRERRARHEDRRDRPAPHRDLRHAPICILPIAPGMRRRAVLRAAGLPRRDAAPRPTTSSARTHERLRRCARARARDRAGDAAAAANATGLTRRRRRASSTGSPTPSAPSRSTRRASTSPRRHRQGQRDHQLPPRHRPHRPAGHGAVLADRPAQRDGRPRGRRSCQPARRAYGFSPGRHRSRRAASGARRAWPTRAGLKAVDLFEAIARRRDQGAVGHGDQSGRSACRDADAVREALQQLRAVRRVRDRAPHRHRRRVRACPAAGRRLGREGRHGHQFGAPHLAPARLPAAARRGAAGLVDRLRGRAAAGLRRARSPTAAPADIFREHAALSAFENDGARDFDIGALAGLTDDDYDPLDAGRCGRCQPERHDGGALLRRRRLLHARPAWRASSRPSRRALRAPTATISRCALNTGRVRDQWHTMTRTGQSRAAGRASPEPMVEIHPDDARARGIADGGFAEVDEPAWRAPSFGFALRSGQQRGSIFAPMHWSDPTAAGARRRTGRSRKTIRFPASPSSRPRPRASNLLSLPIAALRSRAT